MTSDLFGTPKMIVPYEWIFECVEGKPMTMASNMILFRGEKVFRVGLKNYTKSPMLFFMVIDLGKFGMKVEDVKYGIQGSDGLGPSKMTTMTKHDFGEEGNLQLFTMTFLEKIVGNGTFVFRICIEGTDPGFSYQLCDRLAKEQLYDALKSQQKMADVEFVVKDKTFPAHKSILAARSPVFADEFKKKKQAVKDSPHQIRIKTGVEPSTVVNFLHFIYTGEPKGTLADEELLKLADRYQLTILTSLCKVALKKMDAIQMENLRKRLNSNAEDLSSSKIMPEKETEIFFDRTTPTFRCSLMCKKSENGQSKCVMQYQNENIFIAYYTKEKEIDSQLNQDDISKPIIHFSCAKHRSFGLQVEDIYCGMQGLGTLGYIQWLKMESKRFQKTAELLHFAAQALLNFSKENLQFLVYFDIKTVSTIGNYYYEMMDDKWSTDFWMAATNQKLTDVEIFVGTVKVMEAHRVILCARSPILNESFNKISNIRKSIVTFGAEFDVDTVQHFLNFLYTGSLKTTDNVQQLGKLATMYEVETLTNICQLFNRVPDVEELTDYLLQL